MPISTELPKNKYNIHSDNKGKHVKQSTIVSYLALKIVIIAFKKTSKA